MGFDFIYAKFITIAAQIETHVWKPSCCQGGEEQERGDRPDAAGEEGQAHRHGQER
jgi:hypothetical protein